VAGREGADVCGKGCNEVDGLLNLDGVELVIDHDVEAVLCKADRDGAADSMRRSSGNCDAMSRGQFEIFLVLLSGVVVWV
jgi:hypothetical protein